MILCFFYVYVCILHELIHLTQATCHVLLQAIMEERIQQLLKEKDENSQKEVVHIQIIVNTSVYSLWMA